MKILGVIPARYNSTRLPGKPIVDIGGCPMIQLVYNKAKKIIELDHLVVATDDLRIKNVCDDFNTPVIMTGNHNTAIDRIAEVSQTQAYDAYVCINCDEPMFDEDDIIMLISEFKKNSIENVISLRSKIDNPAELIASSTHKVTVNKNNYILYLSRSPIPYPQSTVNIDYYKILGLYIFNKKILGEYQKFGESTLEKIESSDILRFVDNGVQVKSIVSHSKTFSVDTKKDLELMRKLLTQH